MELIILIIIANLISNVMKASKAKREAERKRMQSASSQGFGQGFEPGSISGMPAAKPAAPAVPAKPMMPPRQEIRREVIQPKVHTHLAPDCKVHDRVGSLKVTSMEGKDPCHAQQLAPAQQPRPVVQETQEKPGLQLDWSGENMVKAFVMQEVLTRPCERRRRA